LLGFLDALGQLLDACQNGLGCQGRRTALRPLLRLVVLLIRVLLVLRMSALWRRWRRSLLRRALGCVRRRRRCGLLRRYLTGALRLARGLSVERERLTAGTRLRTHLIAPSGTEFLGCCCKNCLGEPATDIHALAACGDLGGLTRLGCDSLDAPG